MVFTSLNVLALVISEETRAQLESTLARLEGVNLNVRMVGSDRPLAQVGKHELPDVILLEINGHQTQDVDDVKELLKNYGDRITVFVTYKNGDMNTMRSLMRAGVRDAFPQPIPIQELVMDITQAVSDKRTRLKDAQGGRGGVTSFINAKGGSGATTLAVNTAYSLVVHHKASVLLIDLDIQFGVCAMCLDLRPKANILDALTQHQRLDPVFLQALTTEHKSGLKVLASPGEIAPISNLREEAVSKLVAAAIEAYEYVIIDVPRLFTPWTLAALRASEPVLLVVQNTLSTVIDAKNVLDHLPGLGVPEQNIEVINNRALSEARSVSLDRIKETVGKTYIHRVRNDYEAAVRAQDQGLPLEEVAKRSHATKDIEALASYLATSHLGEESEKKGFLGRLFGGREG